MLYSSPSNQCIHTHTYTGFKRLIKLYPEKWAEFCQLTLEKYGFDVSFLTEDPPFTKDGDTVAHPNMAGIIDYNVEDWRALTRDLLEGDGDNWAAPHLATRANLVQNTPLLQAQYRDSLAGMMEASSRIVRKYPDIVRLENGFRIALAMEASGIKIKHTPGKPDYKNLLSGIVKATRMATKRLR